ncbi:ATP-dependent helicase [Treponema denticola]|uniref:UvrD-helicase domain-containing protein n=1 Tax=Treponema denticola TaxID=158 RepID=UPI003D6DDFE0
MQITITNEDIEYAEKILLPANKHFDEERRNFITNLDTIDLQAVPGSGKTTALLAKLIILEKKMPFPDGSGVLILSHTNTAVEEIQSKLQTIAPKLFNFPNFVGTIQSFTDTFLALPYYAHVHKTHPYRIDDDIYFRRCELALKYKYSSLTWFSYRPHKVQMTTLLTAKIDQNGCAKCINGLKNLKCSTAIKIAQFKYDNVKKGFLTYNDAFEFANFYINDNPRIVSIFQKRFKYVFVDEMQDMHSHQIKLLDALFYTSGHTDEQQTITVFQRIGDVNQSIFGENDSDNSDGSTEKADNSGKADWKPREHLTLLGSHRLSPCTAAIVSSFAVEPNAIQGLRKNADGTAIDIKPYLFVYKKENIKTVIKKFAHLIYKLQNEGKLPMTGSYAAVGWRKSILDDAADNKLGISDYYDSLCAVAASTKINYSSLTDHLLAVDPHKKHLETMRKSILNALLHILYMQKIQDKHGRYYTIRTLFKYLKEETDIYELFKRNLFRWCKQRINSEPVEQTIHNIQAFLPDFLQAVSLDNNLININNDTYLFITNPTTIIQNNKPTGQEQINTYSISGIDISIKTVHTIKGQTVTGLLYMETYNSSMHESNRLVDCFIHKKFRKTAKTKKSGMMYKAAKTVYVGFSRPTHLLCFAVQKERFDKYLSNIDRAVWDIIDI